ncbi:MAG: ATP-dependent 6-phosphofructokinase [Bryobacteraceae bacterium]|nr:ATP-dependent 6-phosphofructokinase [Bryobacteraceae bacterium]
MPNEFAIASLGPCMVDSPLVEFHDHQGKTIDFVEDTERILVEDTLSVVEQVARRGDSFPALELAGPRRRIFFKSTEVRVGIVTCGGLCPGLNNVIRSLVIASEFHYRVQRVYGFRYGYAGLASPDGHVILDSEGVSEIHKLGGTVLGSSRGQQDVRVMVDRLIALGVNVLFVIGGDGTMRGALALAEEVRRRGCAIAIVAIPKTIDNDLRFMDQSFGYQTAFSEAVRAIDCAHREAKGAPNGIGLVKLMGRHSGFIACSAALASGDANFVLIPEVPFKLEGPKGFLEVLRRRLERRKHAVIVVAEGAGQDLFPAGEAEHDASGNIKLKDIGTFLSDRIKAHFRAADFEVNVKYIDPSYIIRSVPANPADAVFCTNLALNAVHAAMCGKTEMVLGMWHRRLVHVPIRQAISERNRVDPTGPLWLSVLGATGQPLAFW